MLTNFADETFVIYETLFLTVSCKYNYLLIAVDLNSFSKHFPQCRCCLISTLN